MGKNKLPDNCKLAEAIHAVQCSSNHEDGCSWHYEDWVNPGPTRKEYLKKADSMLDDRIHFDTAMKVIKHLY